MLLYITGGVGFFLSVLSIFLILIFHKKDKSKIVPLIIYFLGFVLFMGSGFLHWKGFELDLPGKEPSDDVQQDDVQQDDVGDDSNSTDAPVQNNDTDDDEITTGDENTTDQDEPSSDDLSGQENPSEDNTVLASLESLASAFELILSESYSGCDVTYDDAGITANVWVDGIAMALAATQEAGGNADDENWVFAKTGTLAMAGSLRETMDTAGHTDKVLVVNVLNDLDHESRVLSIVDTTIVYDVLAE